MIGRTEDARPDCPLRYAWAAVAGSASVVLVRFKSRRAAERMVASLGRDFRKNAHKGKAAAFIVATIRTVHSNSSSPVC